MNKKDKIIYLSGVIFLFFVVLLNFDNIKKKKKEIQKSYEHILEKNNKAEFEEVIKKIDEHIETFPNSDKINDLQEIKKNAELKLEEEKNIIEEKKLFERILKEKDSKTFSYNYTKQIINEYKNKYNNFENINEVLKIEEEVLKKEEIAKKIEEEKRKEREAKLEKELKAQKAEEERAKKSIYTKYDEFDKVKWFYAKDNKGNKTTFAERISIYGGGSIDSSIPTWLRLRLRYSGDDWIFFNSVTIYIDGETYFINFNYFDGERDTTYYGVVEYYDIPAETNHILLLNKIVNSTVARIRYKGKYTHDITINSSEKQKIKNLLIASENYYSNIK